MRHIPRLYIIVTFYFLFHGASFAFASTTNGTIDSVYKYAWGDKMGWINFAASSSNISISDSAITGYAWSANYGWINLAPTKSGVKNNGEGTLSGDAWSAGLGWIDFSGVKINTAGYFTGTASSSVAGTINFSCTNCKVTTDWRPISERNAAAANGSNSGGAGGGGPYVPWPTSNVSQASTSTTTPSLTTSLEMRSVILHAHSRSFLAKLVGTPPEQPSSPTPPSHNPPVGATSSSTGIPPFTIFPPPTMVGTSSQGGNVRRTPTSTASTSTQAIAHPETPGGRFAALILQFMLLIILPSVICYIIIMRIRHKYFSKNNT